ncbi:hypothetical protein RB195_006401 [Necator americanus]|uniref:Uncharacterized protein n=1 Tax=Necator americanus TaxID=51031 RepID=A0ABR1BSF4_NECAM
MCVSSCLVYCFCHSTMEVMGEDIRGCPESSTVDATIANHLQKQVPLYLMAISAPSSSLSVLMIIEHKSSSTIATTIGFP